MTTTDHDHRTGTMRKALVRFAAALVLATTVGVAAQASPAAASLNMTRCPASVCR